MTPQQLVKHYMNKSRGSGITQVYATIANDLGVSARTISNWVSWKYIPLDKQALIEIRTKRALKMDKGLK